MLQYVFECLERELCAYLNGVVRLCLAAKVIHRNVSIVELHIEVLAEEVVETDGDVALMTD